MKDIKGRILYIGKAINLKKRVSSYFRKNENLRLNLLVKKIHNIEFYTTASEQEALILEASLIRKEQPPYNIKLKDDKNYPYLSLTNEPYPYLTISRNKKENNLVYFGPYTSVKAMRQAMSFISKNFKLRKCKKKLVYGKPSGKPCIYFQMEQCLGICKGDITEERYNDIVQNVILFLNGNFEELIQNLENKMKEEAQSLKFEAAARLRNLIEDIKKTVEKQHITLNGAVETDIITAAEDLEQDRVLFSVVFIRNERITGRKNSICSNPLKLPLEELTGEFLKRYYTDNTVPQVIICEKKIPDTKALQEWLSSLYQKSLIIKTAETAAEKRMLSIITYNTKKQLEELKREEESKPSFIKAGLKELKKIFKLKSIPQIIEGVDISNLGKDIPVASLVHFKKGIPEKKEYRKFHMHYTEKQNDFAMIREVVARRFQRLINEKKPLPDLVLIDGGPGQLSEAKKILDALNIKSVCLISLAKKEELIYLPDSKKPLRLEKHSPALRILQSVRDEAHRFAICFHRDRRLYQFKDKNL